MAPKINSFYVQLSAAITAEQHFGFGGRLSRRTDLRLSTFSFCYYSYFSFVILFIFSLFLLSFIIVLFSFILLELLFFCLFIIFNLFDFLRSPWCQIALLDGCPGLMM